MNKLRANKGRIDIMTAARNSILHDFKRIVNANMSDDEEKVEQDEDYTNMSLIKKKNANVKRRDSD